MPKLGLSSSLSQSVGMITPGVVTSNLVMKYMYPVGEVQPLSDGACYFDGTDDYIDLGSKATSGDDATISAWIYLSDSNVNDILRYGDLMVRMQDATSLLTYPDGGGTVADVTIPSALNKWTHICTVIDDNAVTVYHNGAFMETVTGTGTLSTDSTASYIGRYDTDYFKGYICNVGFWTRTLDIAEVKSIMWKQYEDLTTSELASLLSWWNLDVETNTSGESGTGGVKDHHGSNHGTLS